MAINWDDAETEKRILNVISDATAHLLPRTVQEIENRTVTAVMYFSLIKLGWDQISPRQSVTGFDSLHSEFAALCDVLSELEETNNG